jgi:hypothetical protein
MLSRLTHLVGAAFQSKWCLVRVCLAAWLLYVLIFDNPARLARLQFNALPALDYVRETSRLRQQKRYAEALLVADDGLQWLNGDDRAALEKQKEAVLRERDSILRNGSELLRGAVLGEGDSLEALIGAVTADFFVVGDIRDLLIQGAHRLVDGQADDFILALSAIGVILKVAPEIEWIPSILKFAKKAGALSKGMIHSMLQILKTAKETRDLREVEKVFHNLRVVAEKATPAGTVRVLKHLDNVAEIEEIANFVTRHPSGGFVLHVTGKEGVEVFRSTSREAENALVLAARKGERGTAWLRTGNYRLLTPHPILGLVKVLHKGTLPRAIERFAHEFLDPYGWLIIPAAALWLALEVQLLVRRFGMTTYSRVAVDDQGANDTRYQESGKAGHD